MFKKAKKSIAWLAILVLTFSIMTGYFATVQFAKAAGVDDKDFFKGYIASKVEYGDTFSVPSGADLIDASIAVIAPNDTAVDQTEVNSGSIVADQLGVYEVTITNNLVQKGYYKYNVECYIDGDYILVVDHAGATIPTYWQARTDGKTIELPDAFVYVYDEDDNIYVKDATQKVSVAVTPPEKDAITYVKNADGTVTKDGVADGDTKKGYIADINPSDTGIANGTWFFTYYAEITGKNNVEGAEILTKAYSMNVLAQFEDTKAPTLSLTSLPPSTASVNTKVSIPTANASDNFDERVIVDISVKHNDEDVKQVKVDRKTGYVARNAEGKPIYKDDNYGDELDIKKAANVLFDNDMFMYFYPTETGTYTVTYEAQDTSYKYKVKDNNKNVTVKYVYTITVTDTTAPVFDKIDDYQIPTEWAEAVIKYEEGNAKGEELVDEELNVHFPIPTVYDNNTGADDITMSFNFTDPNGRTVAYFDNINAKTHSDSNKYTGTYLSGINNKPYYFFRYEDNYNIDANGLLTPKAGGEAIGYDFATAFNFENWKPTYTNFTKYGSYSIVYRAYDAAAASNFQTKSYSIKYSTEYTDMTAPSIYFSAPKFINFTNDEEEVSINSVSVVDTSASRVNDEYYLVFNTDGSLIKADGDYTDAEFNAIIAAGSGDTPRVKLNSSVGTTTMDVQKKDGACQIIVYDEDNNKQTVKVDDGKFIYVAIRATDSVGNTTTRVERIGTVDATVTGQTITVAKGTNFNVADGKSGVEYLLGDYEIGFEAGERKHTGFELYAQRVLDSNDKAVDDAALVSLAFETYSPNDGASNTIYVDNIRFTPNSSGTYMIVMRAFNISGESVTKISYVSITGATNNKPTGEMSTVPTIGDVNVTYSLQSEYSLDAGEYVVNSISGGRLSLMYDQFTAMSKTTYTIKSYTVASDAGKVSGYDINGYVPVDSNGEKGKLEVNHSSNIQDNEVPEIRVQGIVPSYSRINTAEDPVRITLPKVSATSKNGIASDLKVKVTDNDGISVTTKNEGGGSYSFVPNTNGTYRVTYTATLNGNTSTETFEIKVGDVTAPVFDIIDIGYSSSSKGESIIGYIEGRAISSSTSSNATASVGDEFKFGIIDCWDESTSGYSYLKQLISSDNEVVDSTTSASSRGNSSKITFTMSGQYTVVYTVTDKYGNASTIKYYITVNSSTTNVSTEAITTLSIVLIIVGVILIAGVIIYLVRFRKHKRA